jgi:cytochrome c oxidase subunit II
MTGIRAWRCATAAAALLGGCGDNQSVLNPKGPEALALAHLSWLLFALGTIVLILVMLATAVAIRGPHPLRTVLASARTVVWAGIVFPAVTLTALLGYGVWLTRASTATLDENGVLRIEVVGEQWWWRVTYPQPAGLSVATANEIRIPTGRPVLFTLQSADVIHSFWVPNLGGKMDMIPGRTTHLRLRADHAGVFRGQCAEYCGGPHALMALEVVAMPSAEFDTWLHGQAQSAAEPASQVTMRGRELFLAAGCGACHAVRGTAAAGKVGPDLTHLGSRRSVGLDTAAMTQANIARFIRDGQHIKPGNLMPPFRIFAPEELDAIARYLAGLR